MRIVHIADSMDMKTFIGTKQVCSENCHMSNNYVRDNPCITVTCCRDSLSGEAATSSILFFVFDPLDIGLTPMGMQVYQHPR